MKLFHNGLKDLLSLNQYSPGKKIGFLSIETDLPELFIKLTQALPSYALGLHIRREYRHIMMALRAFKLQDADTLFVFEIYSQHLLLTLPLLALTGKEVLLSLHGNQQFAMTSKVKYLGLLYLKLFLNLPQFKALTLEIDDDVIPEKYQLPDGSKLVIPHPILTDMQPNLKPGERWPEERPIKVGVVGMIRPDKPIAKLIEELQQYLEQTSYNCELIIGTPFWQRPDYLDKFNCTLVDTAKEEDYLKVLQQIDILVIHYDQERYYYRTSGVISDAGSCGCYIIASDYPVIKHQVNWPAQIGSTFKEFAEIGALIDEAIPQIRSQGQDNHWLWREGRAAKAIANILFKNEKSG